MNSQLAAALAALRDELLHQIDVASRRHVHFKVATTEPFTVYLSGGSIAVPALKVSGATYSVNDVGIAIVIDGSPPVCLKTTT